MRLAHGEESLSMQSSLLTFRADQPDDVTLREESRQITTLRGHAPSRAVLEPGSYPGGGARARSYGRK